MTFYNLSVFICMSMHMWWTIHDSDIVFLSIINICVMCGQSWFFTLCDYCCNDSIPTVNCNFVVTPFGVKWCEVFPPNNNIIWKRDWKNWPKIPFCCWWFLKIQISKETCSQRHIYSICFKFSIIIWIYYCLSFKIFYVDNPNWPSHGRDPYDMCLSSSNSIMHPVVGRGAPMLRK